MAARRFHGASQDGQPPHQLRGPRGFNAAERGHPGHARGGVRVLQVRRRPSPPPCVLTPPGPVALGEAAPRLREGETLRPDWEIAQRWVPSRRRTEWPSEEPEPGASGGLRAETSFLWGEML